MKRNASQEKPSPARADSPGCVELGIVLEAQCAELRSLLGPAIRLEISTLTERSEVAQARRGEIVDLLRHLALDARDAMPAGGVLKIVAGTLQTGSAPSAHCATLVIREIQNVDAPPGTGHARKGRSLGLCAAYAVIESAGGHLLISCKERETVTTICFPPAS